MAPKTLWELRITLSALWTARMLSGLQGDSTRLHDPVALRGLLEGTAEVQVAPGLLVVMSVIFAVPILMVFLSLVMKEETCRRASRGLGTFFTLFDLVFLGLGLFLWPFSAYEAIWSVVYLFFTGLVAWYAWTWPVRDEVGER
jgi:hypothetical protein